MAYKQPSSGPFKMMGSSPMKQKDFNKTGSKASTTPGYSTTKGAKSNVKAKTHMKIDWHLENKKALNQKIAKVKKPTSTLSRVTKALGTTPSQLARQGKEVLKTTNRNLISGGKQILKKGAKFLGGKTLGVAGMLMATSSKADQPTDKQKNQNQFKKPDFKATNKDLAKSMYKPLPK